jgi:hypothetical protein
MKKAAEVSLGGFARTRCFSSCLAAPPGLVLEDAGNRHVRPRAFDAIAVAIAILPAKQASARGRYRGPRRFLGWLRWLAQARHDKVTLSGALVAVKKFFATFLTARAHCAYSPNGRSARGEPYAGPRTRAHRIHARVSRGERPQVPAELLAALGRRQRAQTSRKSRCAAARVSAQPETVSEKLAPNMRTPFLS